MIKHIYWIFLDRQSSCVLSIPGLKTQAKRLVFFIICKKDLIVLVYNDDKYLKLILYFELNNNDNKRKIIKGNRRSS
jgi:hypothetical protein